MDALSRRRHQKPSKKSGSFHRKPWEPTTKDVKLNKYIWSSSICSVQGGPVSELHGTSRSSLLGEANINLDDYADASTPASVALPLHGSNPGSMLHVTVQLLTSKTGFREFEQQSELRERGLQTTTRQSIRNEPAERLSSLTRMARVQTDKGDPIFWVRTHRYHHKVTDTERDPHSPVTEGLLFAHMGWLFDYNKMVRKGVNYNNVRDLENQPYYRFLQKTMVLHAYPLVVLLYLLGGFPYVVWGMSATILVAFIGGTLFVLQQFAGINGVLYFSSLTFQDVGISSSALASLSIGLTNIAGALVALNLIDKQGRRQLLIGSYLGMAASMFLVVYAITCPLDEHISHNLSVLGTLMYIFTFVIVAGPVTGLIIPELSSSRTRRKIMGFSFSVHWVCNFLVGLFFLELVERLGVAPVYSTFGGVSLLSAVFVKFFIDETKDRSLEEIEMSRNAQK